VTVGVIIVAGGRGVRIGGDRPKQLLRIGNRTMLQHSVAAFDRHPSVAEIVVVLPSEVVARGQELVGTTAHACRFAAGGERRQDSVASGFAAMSANCDLILVHDAARPFVTDALISRVIDATETDGVVVPALPASDTVKRVHRGERRVCETIPRDELWLVQTPQGFRREVLIAVFASAGEDATDEASLAERAGFPVHIVTGERDNVKITTPEDLAAARTRTTGPARVGSGYDLHRLVAGRPLVLAGVTLPFDRGPDGHSDGDVLCHALADAIFGAAALGDIGGHFSNTDPRWKDAAGLDLLGRAVGIIAEHGYQVSNVDATVILERPKLGPVVTTIREQLARVLGCDVTDVSVKGKTNEGVDAVGRGEAIAAHANAIVRKAV